MTQQIWTSLLESDRVARYYSMLADKLRWRHNILTAILIISATAAASLLAQLPNWVSASSSSSSQPACPPGSTYSTTPGKPPPPPPRPGAERDN